MLCLIGLSVRSANAEIASYYTIGSFGDASKTLAAAQSEAVRSVDDSFPNCSGGSWSITSSDSNGGIRYGWNTNNQNCGFGATAEITFVTRVDCSGDLIGVLAGSSSSGYGEGQYECQLDCTWPEVYDSISGTCQIYDDCPSGEVADPNNPFECTPDDCQAGDTVGITYGTYWANNSADINVSVPSPICVSVCEANPTDVELVITYPGSGCGNFNGDEICTTPTGYSLLVTATKNGTSCSGDTPAPNCQTCDSPPDPGVDPDAPQDEPQANPDPIDTQSPSGPVDETTTTTDNGDGTTTTTTTTTYGDGSATTSSTTTDTATGNTTSSTTTTIGQSQNEDGPEKERQYGGGGCAAKPLCSGDAIDCAIAGHVWETKCALDSEGVSLDETALETEIGSTDLETLLDGGEVDASDPLSIGGYTETAAPSCPAGITVNFLDTTETMDWTFMCQFLLLARPIVHAVGLFLALTIFYRGVIREA